MMGLTNSQYNFSPSIIKLGQRFNETTLYNETKDELWKLNNMTV